MTHPDTRSGASLTSAHVSTCAPEALSQPQRVEAPQTTIDGPLPPLAASALAAAGLLAVLFLADAAYSIFFEWMVTQ